MHRFLLVVAAGLLVSCRDAVQPTVPAARDRLLARFDRRYLTRVVMRAGGNLSEAARLAQVDRTTFYRLMERHGLQRDLLTGGSE